VDRDRRSQAFYLLVLPLMAVANLALGVAGLTAGPGHRAGWAELAAGGFCFAVAGFLAGAAVMRSVWRAAARQQARRWRRLFEVLLRVTELAELDATALRGLKDDADAALNKEA